MKDGAMLTLAKEFAQNLKTEADLNNFRLVPPLCGGMPNQIQFFTTPSIKNNSVAILNNAVHFLQARGNALPPC